MKINKIIFHFPEDDPNSNTMKEIIKKMEKFFNQKKNKIAITTGNMLVYRIRKGEIYQIVEQEIKVKNPILKRLKDLLSAKHKK